MTADIIDWPDGPPPPRKEDCRTCAAGRDDLGRMPIGLCGDSCLVRRHRRGEAVWNPADRRWE